MRISDWSSDVCSSDLLKLDMDMLKRPVNVGFSGGEKKRNEMVQMGILDPRLAILDETDSGLDIDALRVVGEGINTIMRRPDKRSEEHTSELQSLMRISYAVFCLKKKKKNYNNKAQLENLIINK